MKNNFIENINDKKYFYSLIEDIENSKVGFYSVGLYPASLAYNCAMHGNSNNILLAPRKDRDLLGAFSNDVLSDMDNETIEKIKRMGQHYSSEGIRKSFDLKDLLLIYSSFLEILDNFFNLLPIPTFFYIKAIYTIANYLF